MFNGCTSLTSFDIKGQRINDGLFNGCEKLAEVTFSADTVYYMGAHAFDGTAITSVTLPKGNYQISANAFANNADLEKVVITKDANVSFGGAPFVGCTAFDTLEVETGNTVFAVEDNILYNADKTEILLVPTALDGSVTIADTVTSIGSSVFAGTALTSIDISNVTKIGDYAFANSAITSIDLTNVTEIGGYAFSGSALTSVNLTGIERIADGTFKDCTALASITGLSAVTEIGSYAFANCTALSGTSQRLGMIKLTTLGDYAFYGSAISMLTANKLETIGNYAFAESKIWEAAFPAVTSIGKYAFFNAYELTSASFGAVAEMGEYAFALEISKTMPDAQIGSAISKLESVSFADDTTVIGDYAFLAYAMGEHGMESYYYRLGLKTVTLPDSVKKIGEMAFAFTPVLTQINLVGVEEIGPMAFYVSSLQEVDISSVKAIGDMAFGSCESLTSVTLGNVERVGGLVFENTAITSLTIPNIADLSYDESWWELDDGGNWVEVTGKKAARLAPGAFAGMNDLASVNVSGNGKLSVIDNVLYMDTAAGKVLVLYPAKRAGTAYTPVNGTVRIDDYAFYNTWNLEKVTIPYTVKAIGSYAFFSELDATKDVTDEEGNVIGEEPLYTGYKLIKNFVFEGVEAPTLEASYHEVGYSTYDGVDDDGNPVIYLTDFCGWAQGLFYTNFKGYFHETVNPGTLKPTQDSVDFELKITYPMNGVGYNSPIWSNFFSEVETSAYAAEFNTQKTIEAIAALPTVSDIQAAMASGTAEEKYAAVKALSETYVQPARILFNGITSTQQVALVTEYDELLAVEKAIRDAKASLGKAAEISSFVIVQNPTKTKYVGGESFDKTGMIVKAIYDDKSEIEVTDYTLDKEVLYAPEGINPVVEITLSYQGKTCTLKVVVEGGLTGPEVVDPVDPTPGDDGEDNSGCGSCGSTISAGSLSILALFVCAAACVLFKKKGKI
jgi:hypothetical protein